jgi:hypothetical protein
MKVFDKTEDCPKCGTKMSYGYWTYRAEEKKELLDLKYVLPEALIVKCLCGYQVARAPLDSAVKSSNDLRKQETGSS